MNAKRFKVTAAKMSVDIEFPTRREALLFARKFNSYFRRLRKARDAEAWEVFKRGFGK